MVAENIDESGVAGETQQMTEPESGLEENVAGALSYFLGFITGVLFFVVDDRPFVRFHAAQSMLLSVAMIGFFVVMGVVNTVLFTMLFSGTFFVASLLWLGFSLVWAAVSLGGFVLWLYMMYSAVTGKRTVLPVVGGMAQNIAAK